MQMNYKEAKKLKYGDKIKILYEEHKHPIYGRFRYLTKRGYIHYDPIHLAPLGQKAHIKYVESMAVEAEEG